MGLLNQTEQPKAKGSNQQDQAQYSTLVKQVIGFLAQDGNVDELETMAQKIGPAKALAMMVSEALQGVGKAAKMAGVNVPMQTGAAALKEILVVMAQMMAKSGLGEDPKAIAQEAMQLIMSGGQQAPQGEQMPQEPAEMGA